MGGQSCELEGVMHGTVGFGMSGTRNMYSVQVLVSDKGVMGVLAGLGGCETKALQQGG